MKAKLILVSLIVFVAMSRANECTNLYVQPRFHTVLPGQSATFSVSALDQPLTAIQWHRPSGPIPGAIDATLALTNIQIPQAGLYWAQTRTTTGVALTSCVARLTVLDLSQSPGIYVALTNDGSSNAGPRLGIFPLRVGPTNNTLPAVTNSDPGVYYALQLSTDLPVFRTVAMSLSRVPPMWLVLAATNTAPRAFYRLEVLNAYAPRDSDHDGIDDVYELEHPEILNPLYSGDANLDPDGNGRTHLQEYIDCFNLGTNALQFISREVTSFNFGAPSAHVEAISFEDSVFNFGAPSARIEANAQEVSVYRAVPGSGPPRTEISYALSREATLFNFGGRSASVEANSKEVSVYCALPGSGLPTTELTQVLSREVSVFNFGASSARIEAVSLELSLFNYLEPL